jgi:hypothetical protein
VFIRPTFNGYLRELSGNEDPHANFKLRVDSLINDKDYDLQQWEDMNTLRELQKKIKNKQPGIDLHNDMKDMLKKWIIKILDDGEDMQLAIKLLRRLL